MLPPCQCLVQRIITETIITETKTLIVKRCVECSNLHFYQLTGIDSPSSIQKAIDDEKINLLGLRSHIALAGDDPGLAGPDKPDSPDSKVSPADMPKIDDA